MTDVELRWRYRFSKANTLFILRLIKETTCQSTQRSNPISAELRVNPQNTVFHQTFIVKCHLSSVKTKVVLLSDRSDVMELPSLVSKCGWHTSLDYMFIATCMLLFLVLPIHISFKIFMKNAIPIRTIFWKMPQFRRRKYSVKSDGVEGKPEGGGGEGAS